MLEVQENFALGTTFCDMKIQELQTIQKFASNDARLTYFRKCSQINDTARLSCDFYQRYMLTDVYWRERFPNHIISNKNKQKLSNGYEQSIRTNYLLENYSAFESSIRIIVQTYKSKKYEKLRYSFEKLFVWFMKELKRENSIPIFQVFTNIRNSMHSNGLFNPYDQENEEIEYQGKKFLFEVGKPIPYGRWQDIFSILKIMLFEFYIMINNEIIKKIKFVKEPYSDFW